MGDLHFPKIKARYWCAILYPENMISDWKDRIADLLDGLPFAYCVHDRDVLQYVPGDDETYMRKVHVHLIVCFPNTTTCKFAFETINRLALPSMRCLPVPQQVVNIRGKYNYLIHDTDSCREKHKTQYDSSERITGNNFDIGLFEQISVVEMEEMFREISNACIDNSFLTYMDLYCFVRDNMEPKYMQVLKGHVSHFRELIKSNYFYYKKSLSEK